MGSRTQQGVVQRVWSDVGGATRTREAPEQPGPMKMAAGPHTVAREPILEGLLGRCVYEGAGPLPQPEGGLSCPLSASLPGSSLGQQDHPASSDLYPGGEEKDYSADDLTPSTSSTSELLQAGDKDMAASSSEEDSDNSSVPSNEERKDIMVGSMYQARIPPLSPYTCQDLARDGDQLLWRPDLLPSQDVERFLLSAQARGGHKMAAHTQLPRETVRDDEQALYELVKCNFSMAEASRRLHFNVKVFSGELCGWSQEESRSFELGYRAYGKNFHLIQANKVRTRSVGECVEYYYLWKRSDRHDYFTQQSSRMARRKYNQFEHMEDTEQDGEIGDLEVGSSTPPPSGLEEEQQEDDDRPRRRRRTRFLLKP